MVVLDFNSKDLRRIYYVDLLVSKYYNTSLYGFCEKYKYDPLFLEIIKNVTNDVNYQTLSYFEVELPDELDDRYYEVESKYSYGKDNRSVAERVVSLGVNWVVEDVIVHKSSSVFLLTGCDNERDLLATPITNMPDIKYVGQGEPFYVEVCSDFTSFMKKNRRYDVRKLKYTKIEDLMLLEKKRVLMLFVDVIGKSFYCTWFSVRSMSCFDKYTKNTVAFEFDDTVAFKDLIELFKLCQKYQPDKSLFSNFETVSAPKQKKSKWVDEFEDEGFWQSLFESEPEFVRNPPDIDVDEEGYPIYSDNYLHDDWNENKKYTDEEREYALLELQSKWEKDDNSLASEFTALNNDFPIPFDDSDAPPEKENQENFEEDYSDFPFIDDPLPF